MVFILALTHATANAETHFENGIPAVSGLNLPSAERQEPLGLVYKRSMLKNPLPGPERELRLAPEIIDFHSSSSPLDGMGSLMHFLKNVGSEFNEDQDGSPRDQHSVGTMKKENSNYSVHFTSSNGGEPKVTGFVSSVQATTLPDGKIVVQKYERPIGNDGGARSLARQGFEFPLMDILGDGDAASNQFKVSRAVNRRRHRRRRISQVVRTGIDPADLLMADPLELLIGDDAPRRRRRSPKRPRLRYIEPTNRRRRSTRRHRLRYIETFGRRRRAIRQPRLRYVDLSLRLAQNPLEAFLGGLNDADRANDASVPVSDMNQSGPDKVVEDLLQSMFGGQTVSNPLQAVDIDESAPESENPLDGLLGSLMSANAGRTQEGLQTEPVDEEDVLGALKGMLGPDASGKSQGSEDDGTGDFIKQLLNPHALRPRPNRIVVPAEDQGADLLDLLNPKGSTDQGSALAQLLGDSDQADESDTDGSNDGDLGELLRSILPEEAPEPAHIQALRQRLPKIDFQEKVPLMNNFYNSRGIRNSGRPLVFPLLGHKRRLTKASSPFSAPVSVSLIAPERQSYPRLGKMGADSIDNEPVSKDDLASMLSSLLQDQDNQKFARI